MILFSSADICFTTFSSSSISVSLGIVVFSILTVLLVINAMILQCQCKIHIHHVRLPEAIITVKCITSINTHIHTNKHPSKQYSLHNNKRLTRLTVITIRCDRIYESLSHTHAQINVISTR